jgi:hypothetical protein
MARDEDRVGAQIPVDVTQIAASVGATALLVGLGVAAYADWRYREVSDTLWVVLALAGLLVGEIALSRSGVLALVLWALVAGFVLEHMVPWDDHVGSTDWLPGAIEIGTYAAVGLILVAVGLRDGVGAGGVPVDVVAVYVSVLFARGLFEARVLYGGADAKALMVSALLIPIFAQPVLSLPANATMALGVFPFAFTLLLNAAVVAIAVPIVLFARNAARGELEGLRSFTGFRIDVRELPDRFVWIRDPTFHADPEEEEVDTSEDDRRLRERQRDRLIAEGVERVWVTPQIPFVVLMAIGALLGVLAGSLAFDLFSLL